MQIVWNFMVLVVVELLVVVCGVLSQWLLRELQKIVGPEYR
jgi:hypothetical protein